jgi:hypothetical protein
MSFSYSLHTILPFAPAAVRPLTANCEIRNFMNNLFEELEKAHVPGVVKVNPPSNLYKYNYNDPVCPEALRRAATEVFFHLLYRGLILPESQTFPAAWNDLRYWKTPRGAAWASGVGPLPEDGAGYMRHLSLLVPALDPVIHQYIEEGLGSFARGSFFSAAVMIGAASEKEIYLLAESLAGALKDPAAQAQLTKQITTGRSLYALLGMVRKYVESCAALRGVFDGALAHLSSLLEAIRVQRNDAVHPNTAAVDEDSVRLSYEAFPHAIEKAEALRTWFGANPGSV